MKTKTLAHPSQELTPWEENSQKAAYEAAAEGIVLLENNGILPLQPGKIALLGAGGAMTIKGGTGSGEVNERKSISILEGLQTRGFQITTMPWLQAYEESYLEVEAQFRREFRKRLKRINITGLINLMQEPLVYPYGPEVTGIDNSQTDTCIYVVSRQAGEGSDRRLKDYCLSPREKENIAYCASCFSKMILVINVGGPFQMDFLDEIPGIGAVIFYAQQGGMGGLALADLLMGKENFSAKLTDSWAKRYEDIPFAMDYSYLNGQLREEYYREGIYVGYRYFDTFGVAPRYPFGYGLSYTDFSLEADGPVWRDGAVTVAVTVKNTGSCAGKEVVQLYASCPQSPQLPKEYQRLVAFEKTGLLMPGESQTLHLRFTPWELASFRQDDSVTVLEQGDYLLRLGNSSRNTHLCGCLRLEEEAVLQRHKDVCLPQKPVQELQAPPLAPQSHELEPLVLRDIPRKQTDHSQKQPLKENLQGLSLAQRIRLTVGSGIFGKRPFDAPGAAGSTTGKLRKKGIANAVMADGPAGVRLHQCTVRMKNGSLKPVKPPMLQMNYLPAFIQRFLLADPGKGTPLYQFATAFPVELALAQTWNKDLVRRVGEAVSREMQAYGVDFWLAPALNIHRNPLCGRNFEYYSEDPLLSGIMAAQTVKGIQSVPGNLATLKHFACNNQEDNRNRTNANVSQRALREIYLRGFGIAVEQSSPAAVMSSYNKLNDVYTPNSYDLLTQVLRKEWGFTGVVMTDWFSTGPGLGKNALCLKAGNDLIMPGGLNCLWDIYWALLTRKISKEDVDRSCANVLHAVRQSAGKKR